MKIPKSTVRLTAVVEECGRPVSVTLWTDPKKDRGFQAANAEQPMKEQAKKPPSEPQPEKPKPELKRFRVTIRSTATVEEDLPVEAKTPKRLGKMAQNSAEQFLRKVTGVHRVSKTWPTNALFQTFENLNFRT